MSLAPASPPISRIQSLAAPLGALMAALAIAAGAFGAHGLKGHLTEQQLGWWHTGAQYHLAHALALLALGLFLRVAPPPRPRLMNTVLWLIFAGLFFFSGSLYVMALTDVRVLGAVTPVGGTCWLAAWALLAASLWPRRAT